MPHYNSAHNDDDVDGDEITPSVTVRHAGRASVRGKIRRVWRPRYLELLDVGHVRYYQQDDDDAAAWEEDLSLGTDRTGTTSGGHGRPPSSRRGRGRRHYKYRLQILHARILDGTTLRDLHVGIPRGMYGWVFRARRLVLLPSSSSSDHDHDDTRTAQVWTADPLKEERDFFCAVPRLEDAQMWVVALQWAAAVVVVGRRGVGPSSLEEEWEHASRPEEEFEGDEEDSASMVSHPSCAPSTPPRPHSDGTTRAAAAAPPSRPVKVGTTVVTKVTGWQVVRTDTVQWALAYRIQVLLLRHGGGGAAGNNSSSTTGGPRSWIVFRTAEQVHALVSRLQRDPHVPLFPVTVPDARKSTDTAHLYTWLDWFLRRLVTDAAWVNTSAVKRFLGLGVAVQSGGNSGPPQQQQPSATDTALMRRRWYAWIQTTIQPLVRLHDDQHVYQVERVSGRTCNTSPEVLVKEWLADRPSPHPPAAWKRTLLRTTSSPSSTTTLWLAAVAGGGTLCMCYWWLGRGGRASDEFSPYASVVHTPSTGWFTVPRLSLRLDVLVVSWVGAAYLGSLAWPRPASTTGPSTTASIGNAATATGKVRRRVEDDSEEDFVGTSSIATSEEIDDDSFGDAEPEVQEEPTLSSPLPKYPANDAQSCWSQPASNIFFVRSISYLQDRVKEPSGPAPLTCRGVDVWMTDNPERHIARHPAVLGGRLPEEDTFLVNFLLPFGNFVAYFGIPPLSQFPAKLRNVWTKFLAGDQQYRDARLKLLPVVVEGPWIVKAAVGPGKSPALLGKAIPLQYFFDPGNEQRKAVYEVDVIITASTIAKGILSVVKGHTKSVSIAFAFIIEAAEQADLPETVLCTFQVHSLHLEDCPILPPMPDTEDENSSV